MSYQAKLYLMHIRPFLGWCLTQGGLHASQSSGLSWGQV